MMRGWNMDQTTVVSLIEKAMEARKVAYAPYSHFSVGAALLGDYGMIYTGCNVENASYGATNCAERTAVFKAVSEGCRSFRAIAICGGTVGKEAEGYAYPCGICRQVLSEFAGPDFEVIVAKSIVDYEIYPLSDLLRCSFGRGNLE